MNMAEFELRLNVLEEHYNQEDFILLIDFLLDSKLNDNVRIKEISGRIESILEHHCFLKNYLQSYEKAISFFNDYNLLQETLRYSRIITDNYHYDDLQFKSLFIIGISYFYAGEYEKSHRALLSSMEKAEKDNSLKEKSDAAKGLAFLFRYEKDYQKSLEYFQLAYNSAKNVEYTDNQVVCLNEIANIHLLEKDFMKSIEIRLKTKELCELNNLITSLPFVNHDLALTYKEMNELEKALSHFEKVLKESAHLINHRERVIIMNNIGDTLKDLGRYEEAFDYLFDARDIASANYLKVEELNVTQTLGYLYIEQNDCKNAAKCFLRALELKDEIYSAHKTEIIAEMETRFETEKKAKEAEILRLRTIEPR